ncbi:hypothetical protein, partial [Rudaea sp.]|uniref:hypothetical protein n=1 Tax=Rudaea sp. TaxID=2136325 RepID=UPI002ED261D6
MLRSLIFPVLLSMLLAPAPAAARESPQYHAIFDAASQSMRMRVCLGEAHAQVSFAADSQWAKRFVADVARGDRRPLASEEDGWSARDWRAGECLSWRADLAAIAAQDKPDLGWRMGDDIVVAPQLWLLRADVQDDDARIRMELPAGWSISAPWQKLSHDGKSPNVSAVEFRIPNTPVDWSASVAFGHFVEKRIELPGGLLRLTILGDVDAAQRDKLERWFGRVAHAVLGAYGRLPL